MPNHAAVDISPILLRQIARDIWTTADELIVHPCEKLGRTKRSTKPLPGFARSNGLG